MYNILFILESQASSATNSKQSINATKKHSIPQPLNAIVNLIQSFRIYPNKRSLHKNISQQSTTLSNSSIDKESKIIDCERRVVQLNNAIQWLQISHGGAAAYVIPKNDLARTYLLKGSYHEDRENFLHSLNVEPPCLYYGYDLQ